MKQLLYLDQSGGGHSNGAYQKSKILAEKAAWNFLEEKKKNNEKCFDLVVMNPVFILG